ncbi:MAG: histidine phosphatase family protein [Deltaproteobacteria bacterium]|jgi:phosphohistidine phosphatase|nr:histidine phosphatase family protein [Deltaproteobacteria bacterium]
MKTLYLVRHAKSSWKYPKLDDFERPLNKRGRKNAPFMGRILKKLKVAPDLVISSPANRAAMTARMIASMINYPLEKIRYSESIYEFSEDALISVIKQINDRVNKAMIVGHNPATNGLANYIGDQPIGNIPTSGVCCLELDISSWANISERCGKLKFFEFPKKHTA